MYWKSLGSGRKFSGGYFSGDHLTFLVAWFFEESAGARAAPKSFPEINLGGWSRSREQLYELRVLLLSFSERAREQPASRPLRVCYQVLQSYMSNDNGSVRKDM